MSRLVVLKTGTTLAGVRERRGDYEDWIVSGLGLPRERVDVVAVFEGERPPSPEAPVGVVVTGSSAMVSHREAWSQRAAAWLAECVSAGTAVLGICYGHQLLAHAHGGVVGPNPRGREMGTLPVTLAPEAASDPLLAGLSSPLPLQVTHVEAVLELPASARRLAASPADPHHAFALGARAWGVQFHPEFDADVMAAYLAARREVLRAEGIDPGPLERSVSETPAGTEILRRFAQLAVD